MRVYVLLLLKSINNKHINNEQTINKWIDNMLKSIIKKLSKNILRIKSLVLGAK